jgi:hypothetical protein
MYSLFLPYVPVPNSSKYRSIPPQKPKDRADKGAARFNRASRKTQKPYELRSRGSFFERMPEAAGQASSPGISVLIPANLAHAPGKPVSASRRNQRLATMRTETMEKAY